MLMPAEKVGPSVPDVHLLLQSLVDPGSTDDQTRCNGRIEHPIDDRVVDRITRHGEGRHHIERDADNGCGVVNPDVGNQQLRSKPLTSAASTDGPIHLIPKLLSPASA